ncbi:MAG TPA: nucleotide sugar dehydrogenase [Thermoanaerobaculia bacterium]|nr:nucleotide sugar dehydrogenase [Thermoanaerobaculia bacterium]
MTEPTPGTDLPPTADALRRRLEERSALIGILGLGYVGLPLAIAFARQGFRVLGFDVDPVKVEHLAAGESYIEHIDGGELAELAAAGRLAATVDFERLGEPDALLLCVPTPLTPQREPDMSYVVATAESVAARLRPGQLVVLESTTYPGTTDELLRGILEDCHGRQRLTCGEHFFLAYSPEREDPANPSFSTSTIPKVVGGADPVSGDLAEALYHGVVAKTVRVSSARAAEATKLTENIFRAVNIALVNELKMVYDRMGIDVWEVLDAAATKPFGFMRFDPGPGWGGHCIPVDPFYLSWKAREYGMSSRFIELAGEVNVAMPQYVVSKLQRALNDRGKAVKGSRVLLLGLAYKRDVGDPRESPAFEILDLLLHLGADVTYHDPHVPEAPSMRTWPDLPPLRSVELSEETLVAQDAVVLVTDHSTVDYRRVLDHAPLVLDSRGIYRRLAGGDGGGRVVAT